MNPTLHYVPPPDWLPINAKPETLCGLWVVMCGPYVMQQEPFHTGDLHDVTCGKCLSENVRRQRTKESAKL